MQASILLYVANGRQVHNFAGKRLELFRQFFALKMAMGMDQDFRYFSC
jgi:hypothetical protein